MVLLLGPVLAIDSSARGINDRSLSARDGDDWPGYGRSFDQHRFSPLTLINAGNVSRLGLVSWLDLPGLSNVATVPLEADGVLYFAAGYSVVHAIDATSGKLRWKYDPRVTGPKMHLAWGVRGLALWEDKVYVGTQDGRLVALDARTGRLSWEVQTTEPGDIRYITGAPLVYKNTVLIGHGGADYGPTRGYVTAYDAGSGRRLWRFYTVPGDPAKGFENKAMEMAAKTWTGEWWKFGGGGTVWNAMTYDPEFNRVYIGTGNGAPWNRKIRSPGGGDAPKEVPLGDAPKEVPLGDAPEEVPLGDAPEEVASRDNLFLCSIVALDADTGEYVWHYQTNPGESWDFNSAMDMVLATLEIDGKPRKVILHAPKNGFFYVIDRETGKLISAEKFAKVTWAEKIDLSSGRPVEVPDARYPDGEVLMWPGSLGAHSWQPMAYSPDSGLVYIPGRDIAGYYNDKGIDPKTWRMGPEGTTGLNQPSADIPATAGQGWLVAWDPLRQAVKWRRPLPGISSGGVLATHGGLVFHPNAGGELVAYDASGGAKLWSADLGVGSTATPITYRVKGKQYVAVLAGFSGQPMMLGSLSAQRGWVGREHPQRLLIFALDGKARLPASAPPSIPKPIDDPTFQIDTVKAARGASLFGNCVLCHGFAAVAGGHAPDLRASPLVQSLDAFDTVVRGGLLESRGMPRFSEFSRDDLSDLQHFLRQRARADSPASVVKGDAR